jgi:glutamate carboxypeptidase
MSVILDHLLGRQEAMTETLGHLVMFRSPQPGPAGHELASVNAVGEFLAQAFGALGASVERFPQTAFADHLRVSWRAGRAGRGLGQVLLLGHMDTVWPAGETKHRPFRVTGNRATGPGTFDMRGGLVIGLFAVRALHELGLAPAQDLVFLFNSDEEVGSPTSRPHIEVEARRSDAVLVLEPSRENALVTWRKGVGRFELELQGLASHSGSAHDRGVSAVEELAHQILRLEAMTDYDRGTTVNVGVVQGGSKVNVRPASARASVDLRVMTATEGQRMTDTIFGLQAVNPQVTLTISGGMNRPPWEASPQGDALFQRARQIGATLGLDLWPAGSGGGSDGNFAAAMGVPTLDGLGVVGNDAHALTEWVDLSSLPRRAALLAELLLELGR